MEKYKVTSGNRIACQSGRTRTKFQNRTTYSRRSAILTVVTVFSVILLVAPAWNTKPAYGAAGKIRINVTGGSAIVRLGVPASISIATQNIPPSSYIETLIYPKLESRSELSYLGVNGVTGYPLSSSSAQPLTTFQTSFSAFSIPILLSESTNPPTPPANTLSMNFASCSSSCEGVYPVVFVVILKGVTIATETIPFSVLNPTQTATVPLNVAISIDETNLQKSEVPLVLPALANLLSTNQAQSLTVTLNGKTLSTSLTSRSAYVRNALHSILVWSQGANHQLIVDSIAPLKLAQLSQNGLLNYINPDLRLTQALMAQVGAASSAKPETFANNGSLDSDALRIITKFGYSNLITPSSTVTLPDQKYTLTSGLRLIVDNGLSIPTLTVDQTLGHDLTQGATNFERANRLTTDLVSIFEDQPNDSKTRVVAINIPGNSTQDILLASQVLVNLFNAQIIKPTSYKAAFAILNSQTPIMDWVSTTIVKSSNRSSYNSSTFKHTSALINSFQSAGADPKLIMELNTDLFSALGSPQELPNAEHDFHQIKNTISDAFKNINLTPNRSVTLTSSKASIPISVTSRSSTPLQLLLSIKSDRLTIIGPSKRLINIGSQTNTVNFVIGTKTLGIFQADLRLTTPDGNVLISETTLQIRSLTFTIAGSALTGFAILILAFWWIRTLTKGKSRNKNLIPRKSIEEG